MATPPEEFSISATERDGQLLVTLRGELDLATAPDLEDLLEGRIAAGQEVVVDLRGLQFMDSSGIRVLIAGHARAERAGTRLLIVRPADEHPVAKIIEVSGLDGELHLIDAPA